jgi:predicted PurR-regulated permease PerM
VRTEQRTLGWIALALGAAAVAVFVPLWAPLVLAAWLADLLAPVVRRLERALGGRRAVAGSLGVVTVLLLATPLVAVAFAFVARARELLVVALRSGTAAGALEDIAGVTPTEPLPPSPSFVIGLVREHGAAIWRVLASVAAASATAVIGAVVFVVALYGLLVHGARLYGWAARQHRTLDARARRRLVSAFRETGRGLIVGAGGTALAQSAVAIVIYVALGVPNAIVLGLMTGVLSFVPAVGTALVWVPIVVVFAVTGHVARAVVLALLGMVVIATVDNVLRPLLARAGSLNLPVAIVFLSMMGGLALVGGWGLMLGPLVVRLAVEALAIERERRPFRPRSRRRA